MKIHKGLTPERWYQFTLMEQLANVGTDVDRIIFFRNKGDLQQSKNAFERALELLTYTILDPKNKGAKRKELCRVREALIDYFVYDNEYSSSDKLWHDYFYQFNYAAALQRGR
jgi:hypothetical protein